MVFNGIYRYTDDSGIRREMAKFTYTGEGERVFPTLAITVQSGDSFEAPSDFTAPDVSTTTPTKAKPAETLGE
jgi:hypothetical protein